MINSKSVLFLVVILTLALALLGPLTVAGYAPHKGDYFSYYEVENLANGTGYYAGYSEHTVVNGTEYMNGISNGVVLANYSYSWTFSNSSGSTETGVHSGNYTWSSTSFLYVNRTDDQTGYVNPTVWFAMDSSTPKGATFYLLNTQMTVVSKNYRYYLPTHERYVNTVFVQGTSNYQRNDVYGQFTATYTWKAYFDPSTGYIVAYNYVEHDSNSAKAGFTYTDNLYVTSSSYPLTTSSPPTTNNLGLEQYVGYIAAIVFVIAIIAIVAYAFSKR
ncbi:MAG: hypothetical protein M1368_07130, partial [Thaumarchaeota archaeon]|nr:hypothetical protein [Nitrososphaerota archaeon]